MATEGIFRRTEGLPERQGAVTAAAYKQRWDQHKARHQEPPTGPRGGHRLLLQDSRTGTKHCPSCPRSTRREASPGRPASRGAGCCHAVLRVRKGCCTRTAHIKGANSQHTLRKEKASKPKASTWFWKRR